MGRMNLLSPGFFRIQMQVRRGKNKTLINTVDMNVFRSRIAQEETEEKPCISEAEAKALTLQRGRDIKAGRSKLIAHDTVMHEMEQMISNYGN